MKPLIDRIFNIQNDVAFQKQALQVFRYQAANNAVYQQYLKTLGTSVENVQNIHQIPFLPIELFKSHPLITGPDAIQITFTSSGTTGMQQSKHFVSDLSVYETSYRKAFELFYGNIQGYCILALLPSYLEREGSSLIYMAEDLIKRSKNSRSGFYLHNHAELLDALEQLEHQQQKTILLGVTYSLLDLAELYSAQKREPLKHTLIMETGGMKGKRKEMIREELHQLLCSSFGVLAIHSEYGMTELLSQAYSISDGRFACPPWMRILIRDVNDPFSFQPENKTGGINIIDLANVNSCAFIATQDLGKIFSDGTFEVLGRFDVSDIRGCNLLV
ncbi:MAG TPA: acyl transferase [Bacteroidia bacterium]|nr:acyl transferase [Bacteroidia bacterium]